MCSKQSSNFAYPHISTLEHNIQLKVAIIVKQGDSKCFKDLIPNIPTILYNIINPL